MTFRQLEAFLVLAEKGSFSLAAEALYTSQSTLSKQIKAMEQELDTRLFLRKSNGIALSSSGILFEPFARTAMEEFRRVKNAIAPFTSLNKKQITICSEPGMTPYGILDIIDDYQRENPGVAIQFREHGFEELYSMLDRREADLALIWEENASPHGYDALRLLRDESVAMLCAADPLAGKSPVSISDLAGEVFSLHQRCAIGKCTVSLCEKAGFVPQVAYRVSRTSSQMELAELGKAAALVMGERAYSWNNPKIAVLRLRNPFLAHVLAVLPREGALPEAKKFRIFLAYKLHERTFQTASPV